MSEPSEPPAVHQTSTNSHDVSPDCPFCTIAAHYQPIDPEDCSSKEWDPDKLTPPGYVLLSTEHLIAFLDIAPLTRGHVLVAPRKHRVKMGDFKPEEMAEIGRHLPLIARSVIHSVLPDIPHDEADYNIVQNNGPGAAQVIPHVHFHIVPRPPLNYTPPPPPATKPTTTTTNTTTTPKSKYPASQIPTGVQQSYIQFGRGRRHELDDDDAAELVKLMREHVKAEWAAEQSISNDRPRPVTQTQTRSEMKDASVVERFMGGIEDAAWIEGSGGLVSNLQRRSGGKL